MGRHVRHRPERPTGAIGRHVNIRKDGAWDRRTGQQWRDIYIDGKWSGGAYQDLQTATAKARQRIDAEETK